MKTVKNRIASMPPAIYIIVVLLIVFSAMSESFFSLSTFTNIINQSSTLLLLACGQTLVVMLQGTDLSLGFQLSVVSVFWVWLLNHGVSMPMAILLAVLSGVFMGVINGLLVAKLNIPVFIVTLSMANIYRSIALLLSDGFSLTYSSKLFSHVKSVPYLGFPLATWIAVFGFLLTLFVLHKTRLGIRVRALGGNPEALRLAGSNTAMHIVKTFAYVGFMSSLAGLVLTCRVSSGNPLGGDGYEFNAVAAALLGGSSLREGNGDVSGTLFGVLMLQMFKSGLQIVGVSSLYQTFLIGAVVILALVIDAIIKKSRNV